MLNQIEMEKLSNYINNAVHMDITEKIGGVKEVIIEYVSGKKMIAQFNNGNFNIAPYEKFSSIQNYVSRGNDGNAKYRGNCGGKMIEQYIRYVQSKLKNEKVRFADPMVGSGTSKDVCKRLGVSENDSWFGDLRYGFNAMKDHMPIVPNTIWVHPPYYVHKKKDGTRSNMPQYSGVQWGNKNDITLDDGSHQETWTGFLKWINELNYRLFEQLSKGGYMAVLIGASRCEGQYFDPLSDMNIFGKLDSVIVKKQNNTYSEKLNYTNNSFIPIEHEYLIIMRKNNNLVIPVTVKKEQNFDMQKGTFPTWRGLIQNLIENMGGQATLDQLEGICKIHPKGANNNNIRPKLRQVLNSFPNVFIKVKEGTYQLNKGQNAIQNKFAIV